MSQTKKLFIKTYGCQMNVYDSQRMSDILNPLGFSATDEMKNADMVILNTCHIREKATEKVFSELGRIKPIKDERLQQNQDMLIAVAGCVAQAEGAEIIKRAPYVDMVFGPQSYHQLPEMIARATRQKEKDKKGPGRGILNVEFPIESKFDHIPKHQVNNSVSAFVTIQEGCDKFCKFCCVPYTRGAEYSRPVTDIIDETKALVDQGVVEVTLLGQNVNAYHGENIDGREWGLGKLIFELEKIRGLKRIRYTTSHPRDVDEELIEAHGQVNKLMPYLHLPVQSGSDRVLKEMNRKHTTQFYLDIITKLRKVRPDIAFSSDFIVGYPGESTQDFAQTMELVKQVEFAQAFSFKYSKRPGTPAAIQEDQISDEEKSERLQELQTLLRVQQKTFNESMIGKTIPVLFENKGRHSGQIVGKSPYLQSVFVQANERLINNIIDVKINLGQLNSLGGAVVTIGD